MEDRSDRITISEEDIVSVTNVYKYVPALLSIPGAHDAMQRITEAFMRAHVGEIETITIEVDERYKPYPEDIQFLEVMGYINPDGSSRDEE